MSFNQNLLYKALLETGLEFYLKEVNVFMSKWYSASFSFIHKTVYQIVFLFLLPKRIDSNLKLTTATMLIHVLVMQQSPAFHGFVFTHYFVISLFILLMLVISNPLFGEAEWIQMWLQFKLYQMRTHSVLFIVLLLLLLLLSCFSCVRFCATPQTAAHQAPPSLSQPLANQNIDVLTLILENSYLNEKYRQA